MPAVPAVLEAFAVVAVVAEVAVVDSRASIGGAVVGVVGVRVHRSPAAAPGPRLDRGPVQRVRARGGQVIGDRRADEQVDDMLQRARPRLPLSVGQVRRAALAMAKLPLHRLEHVTHLLQRHPNVNCRRKLPRVDGA